MALGNYDEIPYRRAEGRDSLSGREVIFEFDDPEFDFGRVVVRASQQTPKSIIRRNLFVGFTGNGLTIDTTGQSGGSSVSISEMEIWLRIKGRVEPGRSYEWEFETPDSDSLGSGIPAVIPALWAGGEQIGAEVTIREPDARHDDRIQRLLIPHGIVELKDYAGPTSGAWIVLLPRSAGRTFTVGRVSFREIDVDRSTGPASTMPSPIRYIPIRSVLEDQIAAILDRSAQVLKSRRNAEYFWPGSGGDGNVATTARVLSALAEMNPGDPDLEDSIKWLGAQQPTPNAPWSVEAAAWQLYCLARHADFNEHRSIIQRQVEFLTDARGEDGGWGATSVRPAGGTSAARRATSVKSDHDHSFWALIALREAAFAGAEVDRRVWRNVMQYWGQAQAYDGGFTRRMGGISLATTSADTATGAAALLAAIDMSASLRGRRCRAYLGSGLQLRTVSKALAWLDANYLEQFRSLGSFTSASDPLMDAQRLQFLGAISGIVRFNDRDHFAESADALLKLYDRSSSLFGVVGQDGKSVGNTSIERTAEALTILGVGAAPPVCQRIVVGDDERNWAAFSGDTQHIVRYLSKKRGRQFNWRRMSIEDPVRELVKTPILFVNVVGPFEWSEKEWTKLREYCLAGGSAIFDIVNEEQAERDAVIAGLARTFPEYTFSDLPAEHPLYSIEDRLDRRPPVKALGNGFRDFLFLPGESWSCKYHLYDVSDHEDAFRFVNNLVTYCLDGTDPPSAFIPSTYAVASVPSRTMKGLHVELGGDRPAYPNLMATMDRLMRANFRAAVEEADSPAAADIVWVSVTGGKLSGAAEKGVLLDAIRSGAFVVADVVGGDEGRDETARGFLRSMDDGISLERLPRTDAIFTGEVPGTQGFDVSEVNLRKALHTRFAKRGRCDLYLIRYNGKAAGVYSAYDLSSGIGYNYFPDCRGVIPRQAREIAMNAFLMAYRWKLDGGPRG